MATNKMPPVPYKTPLVTREGLIAPIWADFFRLLLVRVGGYIAPTNTELDSGSSAIQSTVDSHTTQIATLTAQVAALTETNELGQGPNL